MGGHRPVFVEYGHGKCVHPATLGAPDRTEPVHIEGRAGAFLHAVSVPNVHVVHLLLVNRFLLLSALATRIGFLMMKSARRSLASDKKSRGSCASFRECLQRFDLCLAPFLELHGIVWNRGRRGQVLPSPGPLSLSCSSSGYSSSYSSLFQLVLSGKGSRCILRYTS